MRKSYGAGEIRKAKTIASRAKPPSRKGFVFEIFFAALRLCVNFTNLKSQ
jgi:hypothetical protein